MSSIVYDFSTIDSLSGQITAFVAQMNENLNDVDRVFTDLLANGWQGAAADAFYGQSQKWHQNAAQMAETLQTLSQKLSNAAANMAQADQQAGAQFL
jgi:WXG100 family type VII secretion target